MSCNYEPKLTYDDYLKVPELLSLQNCLSEPAHHDELQFIIVHQVYELWFKLMLHEIEEAIRRLERQKIHQATDLLRRVAEIQRIQLAQVKLLETMRPVAGRLPEYVICPVTDARRWSCADACHKGSVKTTAKRTRLVTAVHLFPHSGECGHPASVLASQSGWGNSDRWLWHKL